MRLGFASLLIVWVCLAQPAPSEAQSGAAPVQAEPVYSPPPSAAPVPVAPAPVAAPAPAVATYPPPPAAAGPETVQYEEEPPQERPVESEGSNCVLGGLCFGPLLTAGIVDVFGIGAQARTDFWGVGIDYQFISFTAKGIPMRLSLLTVEGRLYPFGGAFFLAGGLAWQYADFHGHVSYPGSGQIPPIETDIAGKVSVPVFKLGAGFMGRSGFVMGIDIALGLQLGRTRVELSSDLPRIQQVIDVENRIRDRADTWVRGLPFLLQVNVLRFGFLF